MALGRSSLPIEIQKLIIAFSSLPGIGPKTAQRLTFYILSQNIDETLKLSEALKDVKKNLSYCQCCFFITSEENINSCNFCEEKESSTICVVENIVDAITIEMSGIHSGTFHILHGSISPMNGVGPENLKINELIKRINNESPKEIILATNPTLEGEATSMFLSNFINDNYKDIKITKLAKGLASGTDLEFSDFNTLSNAFENRTNIN
tara:strand:+ start:258 stop:881 length:624 start_codon:yes stop_codon:yes gene_type:complete